MSGLLQDIKSANAEAVQNRCRVHHILSELSKDDQEDLRAALADDSIMHVAIARALNNRGLDIGTHGKAVAAHRKGNCGCARG